MNTARRNAVLLLVLLSVIWSYNWIVMKQVLRYSGPFEFAAWRYALGTVVLFAALRWRSSSVSMMPIPTAETLVRLGASPSCSIRMMVTGSSPRTGEFSTSA